MVGFNKITNQIYIFKFSSGTFLYLVDFCFPPMNRRAMGINPYGIFIHAAFCIPLGMARH